MNDRFLLPPVCGPLASLLKGARGDAVDALRRIWGVLHFPEINSRRGIGMASAPWGACCDSLSGSAPPAMSVHLFENT